VSSIELRIASRNLRETTETPSTRELPRRHRRANEHSVPTAGDGVAARAAKNGISTDMQMWRDSGAVDPKQLEKNRWGRGGAPKIDVAKAKQPEKKFFGLF